MTFGRPGYGAPVRTNSGHLRTSVVGNPEIRFQDDKSVQKAIINNIRYTANREDKEHYQKQLGKFGKTASILEVLIPIFLYTKFFHDTTMFYLG